MFKHIVRQSLRGPAGDWWELVQENVQTMNDFKPRFTERYWCRQTQAKIRNQLEFGYYEAAGNLSRSEYIIRLYNQVRRLSDSPRETDTVDKFSRHFDRDTQQAVITQNIKTAEALVKLLDIQDHIGNLNSSRGPTRYEDFHDTSTDSRREFARPSFSPQNQSRTNHSTEYRVNFRADTPPENRNNFRASTPVSYKGPETPRRDNFTPRRDNSPNYRNNSYRGNTSVNPEEGAGNL